MIVCVIVTYNIEFKIIEVYKNISTQVDKIIIVDNNSDEITKYIINNISQFDDNVEIIENCENYGIAKALNMGIEHSRKYNPKYILTLDHDTIVEKKCVEEMKKMFKYSDDIGVVVPKVYDINKEGYITNVENEECQYVENPIQSGALIEMNVFDCVGNFNEELKTYYVDTDFFYRVLNKKKILQCNKCEILHEEGKKTEKKIFGKQYYYPNYGDYAIYYRARNYVYIKKRYYELFNDKGRLIKDFIRIILFDKNKINKLSIHLKGIIAGYVQFGGK